jgi:hypothetical protein
MRGHFVEIGVVVGSRLNAASVRSFDDIVRRGKNIGAADLGIERFGLGGFSEVIKDHRGRGRAARISFLFDRFDAVDIAQLALFRQADAIGRRPCNGPNSSLLWLCSFSMDEVIWSLRALVGVCAPRLRAWLSSLAEGLLGQKGFLLAYRARRRAVADFFADYCGGLFAAGRFGGLQELSQQGELALAEPMGDVADLERGALANGQGVDLQVGHGCQEELLEPATADCIVRAAE